MQTDTQTEYIPLVQLTPEERAELMQDINSLFVYPDRWLNTPHHLLEGHKPCEFLEPGREQPLFDLIGAIKYGIFISHGYYLRLDGSCICNFKKERQGTGRLSPVSAECP